MIGAAASGVLAAGCALLALWLGWHHPLSPALALAACAVLAVLAYRHPWRWPLFVLPLLPWIGLMPWTGWVVVEELDLVVLAVAAGGWLRAALGGPSLRRGSGRSDWIWLLAPLLLSTAIALQRGVAEAGGLSWSWWHGYREPLNSLRLAKPIVAVWLLLPLARLARPHGVYSPWGAAITLLLLGAALQVLRERLGFTGLLNFSSDYRVTGPFWEMHVGGAALDAALAISMPFAAAAMAAAHRPARFAFAALVMSLGLYAALVSFSRIVYLAVPLGLAIWLALRTTNVSDNRSARSLPAGAGAAALLLALFVGLAALAFPTSGYRGLLALLGAFALVLPLATLWHGVAARSALPALLFGAGVSAAVAAASISLAKGPYLAYSACWAVAALALWRQQRAVATAATIGALAALVAIAVHWGGEGAWAPALVSAVLLASVAVLAVSTGTAAAPPAPVWPARWRWQATVLGAMLTSGAIVGVFGGGAYMGQRMAHSSQDAKGRQAHWDRALDLMSPTAWLLGAGLGRYPAEQALSGEVSDQTGDYRLLPLREGGPGLVLTGGKHLLGFGEMFRVSQRIDLPAGGPARLRLRARSNAPMTLRAEICEKFLLYADRCLSGRWDLMASPGFAGHWQAGSFELKGDPLSTGPWYARRPIVFSITTETPASRVELAHLELVDSRGAPLLVNGQFERGMARWFFSSDKHHMPWHLKNLAMHLLFEQGIFGLAAMGLAVLAALWRLTLGSARRHRLAPPLAAAIVSVLVVGAVDSLMDMPRIAFLTLLLPALALSLPADGPRNGMRTGARRRPVRGP